ncbi:ABC-F family ATP-binding cassette domain-containing protein [uncultured Serinicoccus sp.]|uniref:ABC-F family ATP-binding cassette domain-containing protein n=1 Tax=uncultured Serinicoccus sp. TaxID=735514 RepID=UPI0026175202|nr:ATP-binding cassette domain-containing protein [uncultured Serinicoccus sp.]
MSVTSHLPSGDADGPLHLRVDGVSKSFPTHRVLTDVSLVVPSGGRACLIGENGSGKSTLLRIVAGLTAPDAGQVQAPGTVGLHHQEVPFDLGLTVVEVLEDAVAAVRRLADRVEHAAAALARAEPGAGAALDAAIEDARRHAAWDVEHRAARVVDGLGLGSLPRDRRTGELSGGQLSRLSLAWTLLRSPDTLLLDEPTNHLDDAGTALLTDLLRSWSGPVLLASHDRAFLDEVATTVLDLDPTPVPHARVAADDDSPGSGYGLTRYTGSYTAYLQQRREDRRRWVRRHRDEQAELVRLRRKVADDHTVGHADRGPRTEARASRKFYADRNARVVARRVNDASTALERLEREQVRRPPARLRFRGLGAPQGGPAARPGTDPLLRAVDVRLHGRLAPLSLVVPAHGRLLVTGGNGSGKSTLLDLLAGTLRPSGGRITWAPGLSVDLLSQEPTPHPTRDTARSEYARRVGHERAARQPLAGFGLLAGRDLDRPVAELSVGQRRRLDLAVVLADPPDLLLLDEPTNHLSLLLVSELELALPAYPGAVVVASHDRWLREDWSGERLHLQEPAHVQSAGPEETLGT